MEKMTIEEQLIKGFEFVDAFIGASKQLDGEVVLSMVAVMLDAKFGADSVNKARELIEQMVAVNNELGAMEIKD